MAAFALLFAVTGTLDGSTVFTMPNPLPAPSGGVITIPVTGNLGIIDLLAGNTQDSPTAYYLRTLNIECAAATAAVRAVQSISGAGGPAPGRIMLLQQSPTNPVTPRLVNFEPRMMPKGTRIAILNDSVSAAFGGVPVAGPHRVHVEFDPVGDTDTLLDIYEQTSSEQAWATWQQQARESFQAVAASLTTEVMIPPNCTRLTGLRIANGAVAAAGESMTVAIQRVRAGATQTLLTAASTTIDNTIAANQIRDLSSLILIQFADWLNPATDTIRIVRTYVAGGGPTPMTNTNVQLTFSP